MEAQLTFFLVYVMILEFERGREFQVIPIQSTSAVAMDLNVNTTKSQKLHSCALETSFLNFTRSFTEGKELCLIAIQSRSKVAVESNITSSIFTSQYMDTLNFLCVEFFPSPKLQKICVELELPRQAQHRDVQTELCMV